MTDLSQIQPNFEVIGADGAHVGTVDHVAGTRLKLSRKDSVDGLHHYIDGGLIAEVNDGVVRLSANADVAVSFEDADIEQEGDERRLEEGLEETFPASDPVSAKHIT